MPFVPLLILGERQSRADDNERTGSGPSTGDVMLSESGCRNILAVGPLSLIDVNCSACSKGGGAKQSTSHMLQILIINYTVKSWHYALA